MSKQTKPIRRNCQAKDCVRDAIVGVYGWAIGQTDVDLDRPLRVFCGPHKPRLDAGVLVRNVRLRRS